ncbi:conserved protein of unknown function [Petrocella atlantisensis]|uniref:DUF4097 domain-containing protein n=1 Tax=Petrocella atlantisensis TaxID=2173034 RepID=A0A3P7NX19_9FIRM|nr:DUF4097 family beta strand repeat-containing protein [Petrocella atlantisensis]PKM54426.1 MAG: hypothetical protein CVV00_08270 [Firmicutes bacterium HGW-Firmicutes-5]VDN47774.1 conserved protein of unknown function [Petrocella atlantisensis]
MKNSFDSNMGKALLISISIIALAALIVISYMDKHELSFKEFFNSNLAFNGFDNVTMDFDFDMDGLEFDKDNPSSRFNTKLLHEEKTFEAFDRIRISATTEAIIFVHEDREDIKVVFDREVPDTNKYIIDYKANQNNQEINITSKLRLNNVFTDQTYNGSITLYVPEDYQCDILTIEKTVSELDGLVLPNHLNNLNITSNVGELKIELFQPLDQLYLKINAGNINLKTEAEVNQLELSVNTGTLRLLAQEEIQSFKASNNFGDLDFVFNKSPLDATLTSNAGDIRLDFLEPVHQLDANVNIGSLDLILPQNDESHVYSNTKLTDISSDIPVVSNRNDANIFLSVDVGSINVIRNTSH